MARGTELLLLGLAVVVGSVEVQREREHGETLLLPLNTVSLQIHTRSHCCGPGVFRGLLGSALVVYM